jgi:microcin C transport system permease protein
MKEYILRRLLLMIPTLFGISVVCFTLTQFVPGGPVEEMIAKIRGVGSQMGQSVENQITEEEIENLKAYHGFDKPAVERYFRWMLNVLRLDLGTSYTYEEPVWDVIISRFPISLFFGLTSFFLTYLICIPLGLKKATKHNTPFDSISSIVIFIGYSIPGYALGVLLIVFLGGGSFLDLFPISGIVSDNFEELSLFGKVGDFLHHMVLPLVCYMIGQFAFLTMLMKNSVLEELQKDYMRTALVKGASFHMAVWRHAFRNSLIPLATGIGEIFTLMFAGSVLIEKIFDIDGMGLLAYNSILGRDYNVVLGIIMLSSIMTLLGRLFSDIVYVIVDPRIKYN